MNHATDDGIARPEERRHGKQEGRRHRYSGIHKAGIQFLCGGGAMISNASLLWIRAKLCALWVVEEVPAGRHESGTVPERTRALISLSPCVRTDT